MTKLLVYGSRTVLEVPGSQGFINRVLTTFLQHINFDYEEDQLVVVDGMAKGADTAGHNWAINYHFLTRRFPANWSQYGKRAGYIRNAEMAAFLRNAPNKAYAIGFIDKPLAESKGSKMMTDLLTNQEPIIPTFVWDVRSKQRVHSYEPEGTLF